MLSSSKGLGVSLWSQVQNRSIEDLWRDVKGGLKSIIDEPRTVVLKIEEKSPWLSRQILGVASNIMEPFTIGMGLNVTQLAEDHCEVVLPDIWRNHGNGRQIHPGALVALCEFAVKSYWNQYLHSNQTNIILEEFHFQRISKPQGLLKAKYRLTIGDREWLLLRLRSEETVTFTSSVSVYSEEGLLVAEIDLHWRYKGQLELPPARQN